MPCYVRLMREGDIAQVTEIDREAFPSMWPSPNYRRELQNRLGHYIVACDEAKTVEKPEVEEVASTKGFFRLTSNVRNFLTRGQLFNSEVLSTREYISGFAGFWVMVQEVHIINIAVREIHQRQGIGELLLISAIDLAMELNTHIVTLEVRASNIAAQSLYYKYGFTQVDLRRAYYRDDGEDAVLMSTQDISLAVYQAHLQQLKQAHSRRWGIPLYQVVR